MKLSLQDQVALLYSGSGSQRAVAASLGISHQKVGRLLRIGQPGGYSPTSRVLDDSALQRDVARSLAAHTRASAAQAKRDGIPFDPSYPVFARRMPMQNGVPGDRVEAPHLHWISDALRTAWLKKQHSTGRYYSLSLGSIVNLIIYNKIANTAPENRNRNAAKKYARAQIKKQIQQQIAQGLIHTTYTAFSKNKNGIPVSYLLAELNDKLKEKHEPATGDPGTHLAARALFQIDTRYGKDKEFRDKHPIKPTPSAAKQRKSGKAKKRS